MPFHDEEGETEQLKRRERDLVLSVSFALIEKMKRNGIYGPRFGK
jgi:hypothetical protein